MRLRERSGILTVTTNLTYNCRQKRQLSKEANSLQILGCFMETTEERMCRTNRRALRGRSLSLSSSKKSPPTPSAARRSREHVLHGTPFCAAGAAVARQRAWRAASASRCSPWQSRENGCTHADFRQQAYVSWVPRIHILASCIAAVAAQEASEFLAVQRQEGS